MYCSYCGKQFPDSSGFCPSCGKPTLKQQTENELSQFVERAKMKDQEAIAVLYEKTYTQVFYTVKSMIKDEDAVFDIVQDAYVKAFEHLESFSGNDKFLPWVKQIAANTARDWLKKKKPTLFSELNSGEEGEQAFEEQIEDERVENIPEKVIDQKETKRLIREIIESLPEDQRAVIGMYYYEELSVKEIAAAMGASESAVKSRLKYGRDKIEAKVIELEKNGTKLYGVAPLPFWLLLMHSLKNHAAELAPNENVLQAILKTVNTPTSTATTKPTQKIAKAAGETSKAASKAATTATTKAVAAGAAGAGSLGVVKVVLIALLSVSVIGTSTFAVAKLLDRGKQELVEETIDDEEESTLSEESGEEESSEEETGEEESSETVREVSPNEEALEQYKLIISQASTYNFDMPETLSATGNYKYALVQLQPSDPVQTLLLSKEAVDYSYYVRMFQYDPNTKTVLQPSETIQEKTRVLTMMNDGNGFYMHSPFSGAGEFSISRITLEGDKLRDEIVYKGHFDDVIPDEFKATEIEWYSTGDLSVIDSKLNKNEAQLQPPATQLQPLTTQAAPLRDGKRIVFTGTINEYSYDEVVALQGVPDPNKNEYTDTSERYVLIVLDKPQVMKLTNGDNLGGLRSDEVRMISTGREFSKYYGQHLTFSIDPNNTYWPSDTSLPLGQPVTSDIHILN